MSMFGISTPTFRYRQEGLQGRPVRVLPLQVEPRPCGELDLEDDIPHLHMARRPD